LKRKRVTIKQRIKKNGSSTINLNEKITIKLGRENKKWVYK
jgi:hypothetical protein